MSERRSQAPSEASRSYPAAQATISLWILGGFLGAGKTTVLNALVRNEAARRGESEYAGPRRIGVVVNDFGSVGVDAAMLRGVDGDDVVELAGGQIFCACLSGSFVKSIVRLVERGVDLLLVESSGLAKPQPLRDIVNAATDAVASHAGAMAGRQLRYCGFAAVVDAPRFGKLERVVNAVTEQVVFADALIINKADLVEAETLNAVAARVGELNPQAAQLRTVRGELTLGDIEGALGSALSETGPPRGRAASKMPEGISFRGWDGPGRPVAMQWSVPPGLSRAELQRVVEQLSLLTLRIKGFVRLDGELFSVSAAGAYVEIEYAEAREAPSEGSYDGEGLTVIAPADVKVPELIDEALASLDDK